MLSRICRSRKCSFCIPEWVKNAHTRISRQQKSLLLCARMSKFRNRKCSFISKREKKCSPEYVEVENVRFISHNEQKILIQVCRSKKCYGYFHKPKWAKSARQNMQEQKMIIVFDSFGIGKECHSQFTRNSGQKLQVSMKPNRN